MYDDCVILSLRFPQKLWRIVNECVSGAIRWSTSGNTILLDYKRFQEQYLDQGNSIFKTKNITSFIRQLNLYGFRKVTSHNRDPICNSQNPDVHEFLHENFRTGRPDLLSTVCRKTAGKYKQCQRAASRNNERDFYEKPERQMSRLQMCRLALTRALEQIAEEYRQTRCDAPKPNDAVLSAGNYRQTGWMDRLTKYNKTSVLRTKENIHSRVGSVSPSRSKRNHEYYLHKTCTNVDLHGFIRRAVKSRTY